MSTHALPRQVRIGYALGSVATGSFGTVPGLLLLPYLTDTLGIAAFLAGAIVLLPKALDVVLNPIAGRISDRHVSPLGPRRPFLLRGGVALAVCFALLFAAPDLGSKVIDGAWVLVAFLACATAYAFFQVPYVAMPAEITDDYGERTRLMAWRVAVLTLAILISGGSAPAIRDALGGRDGYRVMGLTVAGLLLIGTVGAYLGTRKAPIGPPAETAGSLREQLRVVAQEADFRRLLLTFMLQALATGGMLAGIDYLARYILGDSSASTVLFLCVVGPALLVSPIWQAIGARFGKERGTSPRPFCSHSARPVLPPRRPCPSPWSTSRRHWWASASPAHRYSRWRCCPTWPRWIRPAVACVARAYSPASGLLGRPSASRLGLGCSRWSCSSGVMCRRPVTRPFSPARR